MINTANTARENILRQIERERHFIEDYEEAIQDAAKMAARNLEKAASENEYRLSRIEDLGRYLARDIEEYRKNITQREARLSGLLQALEILDANDGQHAYAIRKGFYGGDRARKFGSEEERDAWLASLTPGSWEAGEWHRPNETEEGVLRAGFATIENPEE